MIERGLYLPGRESAWKFYAFLSDCAWPADDFRRRGSAWHPAFAQENNDSRKIEQLTKEVEDLKTMVIQLRKQVGKGTRKPAPAAAVSQVPAMSTPKPADDRLRRGVVVRPEARLVVTAEGSIWDSP